MKKLYIAIAFLMSLTACKKALDEQPLEKITEDYVFDARDSVGTQALQVLNDIYSNLPNGFNRIDGNFLDAATDDAVSSRVNAAIVNLAQSRISPTTNPDDAWAKYYTGIRKVNQYISKVTVIPNTNVKFWVAEAKALRAIFYFELLKRYGGIPLLGDRVYTLADNIQVKRNTFAECINYLVAECDALSPQLRTEAQINANPSDFGRISKGAVLSLKSRVLLYAASPLFNGGVAAGGNAEQRLVAGYPTYDVTRWTAAANAAREVINLGSYSLDASFTNVFTARKSNETILSYLRAVTNDLEVNNGPVGYGVGSTGQGITSPSQDLVDAYPMLNGQPINESATYNPANPYAGRDPRLANTVLTNGTRWLNRNVETFEGGLDKPNRGNQVQTRTGYYLRKFLGNFTSATQYSTQNHNYPIFRYTEILLNFAEALNESAGPTTEVYKALTDIRKRAGITAGAGNLYGLKANMTQNEMRNAIKLERRIELAFEEHRYWDLRRWKDAEMVLNRNVNGVSITLNSSTSVLSYQSIVADKTIFSAPKMYLYPISSAETAKNNLLVQNIGW
ncbi:RagB/SusD family nutrient uptake outer membrane protein [Mucilaginibacter sp. PAMB04274]|uniref:RagB/SusD family nutrient uptake outer membrane protein n=1 Tax=Mucilaginibacter sp. PAMB04274 TaxID=3138568 RepID=UPI0031F6536A